MGYTLRVSVLEHCQLRCNYCLPLDHALGIKKNWLTLSSYEKIAEALRILPIEKIRFTGGEPLLRPDLADIANLFAKVFIPAKRAITTNGLRFLAVKDRLAELLHSITFHLDTLKQDLYERIMGQGKVHTVLSAIDEAQKAGLEVKINVVVQKGVNDEELYDFLCLSKQLSVQIRFIEIMNTGSAKNYAEKHFLSGADIIKKIKIFSDVASRGRPVLSSPAELFFCEGLGINFGLIASETEPFCSHCNRLRLSADGRLYTCLYQPIGENLRSFSEEELVAQIQKIVAKKASFHPALNKNPRDFSMSKIGG